MPFFSYNGINYFRYSFYTINAHVKQMIFEVIYIEKNSANLQRRRLKAQYMDRYKV